jgi:hypothetical protein
MTLQFFSRSNYGQQMYYLADADLANAWHQLTGRKTLTQQDMQGLRILDPSIEFTRVFDPREA